MNEENKVNCVADNQILLEPNILKRVIGKPSNKVSEDAISQEIMKLCDDNGFTYENYDKVYKKLKRKYFGITIPIVMRLCKSIQSQMKYRLTPQQKVEMAIRTGDIYDEIINSELDNYRKFDEDNTSGGIKKRKMITDILLRAMSKKTDLFGIAVNTDLGERENKSTQNNFYASFGGKIETFNFLKKVTGNKNKEIKAQAEFLNQ